MRRYPTRTIVVGTLGLLAVMALAIWTQVRVDDGSKLLRLVALLFVAMGGIGFITGVAMLCVRCLPVRAPRLVGRRK